MKKYIQYLLSMIIVAVSWPLAPIKALTLSEDALIATYEQPSIVASSQTPAKKAFMKLVPSLKCTLGWHTCSPEEIKSARLKVKAYAAIFGVAMLAYGIKKWMDVSRPIQIGAPHDVRGITSPYNSKLSPNILNVVHDLEFYLKNELIGSGDLIASVNFDQKKNEVINKINQGLYTDSLPFTLEEKGRIKSALIKFVDDLKFVPKR